jgi:hypothetical protein
MLEAGFGAAPELDPNAESAGSAATALPPDPTVTRNPNRGAEI